MFEAKVTNCGASECIHNCPSDGTCNRKTTAIDSEGKCILFRKGTFKVVRPIDEIDEHTNMC